MFAIAYTAILLRCQEERKLLEEWIGLLLTVPTWDEMCNRTYSLQTAERANGQHKLRNFEQGE